MPRYNDDNDDGRATTIDSTEVARELHKINSRLDRWEPALFGEDGKLGAVQKINIVWGFNTVVVGFAGMAIGSIITLLVQSALLKGSG